MYLRSLLNRLRQDKDLIEQRIIELEEELGQTSDNIDEAAIIANTVGKQFGVNVFNPTRKRSHVLPRQMATSLIREMTGKTLAQIGEFFGGQDHATVLWSIKTNNNLCDTDEDHRSTYIELKEKVTQEITKSRYRQ